MSRIYISGKIGEERPSEATCSRFRVGDRICQRLGYETFNPCSDQWQASLRNWYQAEQDSWQCGPDFPIIDYYDFCLLRDLSVLSTCDAIFMLPGWDQSPGARVEHEYAKATGKLIIYHKSL